MTKAITLDGSSALVLSVDIKEVLSVLSTLQSRLSWKEILVSMSTNRVLRLYFTAKPFLIEMRPGS